MFHEDLLILRNLAGKDQGRRVVHSCETVEELQRAVCAVIWLRLEVGYKKDVTSPKNARKVPFQNDLIKETHALEGL